jgi:protease I
MPSILIVIAPEKYKEEEFFDLKDELGKASIKVTVANSTGRPSISKYGKIVKVQKCLKDVDVKDYDGIVFVGGSGASIYFDDEIVLDLTRKFFEAGKIVGAICIAPTILAKAGVLKGKRATAYMTQKEIIEAVGIYTNNKVEQDGNIITCKWPTAVREFTKRIIETLRKSNNLQY